MAEVAMCGLLPSGYRCKKCGSVNVELECDSNGYYVKCNDCGHYVGGKNAKEALNNWECGSDGKENKMAEVAKLFGKELGEEFEIVTPSGKVRKVKFTTDRGLLYYDRIGHEWNKNFGFLNFLCEGKAVIVDDKQ